METVVGHDEPFASHNSQWKEGNVLDSTEDKWDTTNELYNDFDCYTITQSQCPSSVVSFADVMLPPRPPTECVEIHPISDSLASDKKSEIDLSSKTHITTAQPSQRKRPYADMDKDEDKEKLPVKKHPKQNKSKLQRKRRQRESNVVANIQEFLQPTLSYSCLIALAMRNSDGIFVGEIYDFVSELFPYFKTAGNTWKSNIKHTLSMSKFFEKRKCLDGDQQIRYKWSLNQSKRSAVDDKIQQYLQQDAMVNRKAMAIPENFDQVMKETIERLNDVDVSL